MISILHVRRLIVLLENAIVYFYHMQTRTSVISILHFVVRLDWIYSLSSCSIACPKRQVFLDVLN